MSVINTNVSSLIAQNALTANNTALSTSLERLSTGLQINSGADNPSGLIAVESFNQINTGLSTAITNAGEAANVAGTAEGGLSEISSLLTQVQGLLSETANSGGLSQAQVSANQTQVDAILTTINGIANSTNFNGVQLLNGNLAYKTSGLVTSAINDLNIQSAIIPAGSTVAVNVKVTASAKVASLTATTIGSATQATTLNVTGAIGTAQISIAAGEHASAIANAINNVTTQTGVTASAAISGTTSTTLTLSSQNTGSNNFVTIASQTGQYEFGGSNSATAKGTDATVTVNGSAAAVTGTSVSFDSSGLNLNFNLAAKANTTSTSQSFTITGGGANFAVGALVNAQGVLSLGINNISSSTLGTFADGYLNSIQDGGTNQLSDNANLTTAQKIVTDAISQVSTLRGNLGSFQSFTIGGTLASLNVAFENSSAAESSIQDTNFASETSNLTRDQILQQSAATVLAQANAGPQLALTLLKNA